MRKPFSLREASARWWVVLIALGAASLTTYLGRSRQPLVPAQLEGRTMGTTWSVVLDGPRSDERLAALRGAIEERLAQINAVVSTYDPRSELSRFNQREETGPVAISPLLSRVVGDALAVSEASRGAFDVTVGKLVDVWGFGPPGREVQGPSPETLASLLEAVGRDKLTFDGGTLAKLHPRAHVDLSAIAKGDAVDELSALLSGLGEPNHLVDIGGELKAQGKNARGEPFRVGVEEPDPARRAVRLVVALGDRAIASSGNYRNQVEVDGVRYSHIIDPKTGRPTQHALLAVSVLHERCALADAWATALMAAGPEAAWELAQANGLDALLLVSTPAHGLAERMTAGFEARVMARPRYEEQRSAYP